MLAGNFTSEDVAGFEKDTDKRRNAHGNWNGSLSKGMDAVFGIEDDPPNSAPFAFATTPVGQPGEHGFTDAEDVCSTRAFLLPFAPVHRP